MFRKLLVTSLSLALLACSQQTGEQHLDKAKDYIDQNKYQAAVIELKSALQKSPQLAAARFELGRIYVQQQQFEQAEKELNRAMEYGYPETEVIPLLSRAYQKTGADVALSKLKNQYAGLSEDEAAEVGFYKLESLVRLERTADARSLIEQIKTYDTQSPYKSLALTYSYLLDEEPERAMLQLQEVIANHPGQPDALALKGRLHMSQGERDAAIETYQQYYETNPDDHQISFLLARLLTDAGRTEEAEPILDKLLAISDTNPLLNQLKGLSRANEGDHKAALQYTEKALMNKGTDPGLRLAAGYSAFQLGDFNTAVNHLSMVASDLPADHPGLRLLAASQIQLGLTDEAGETLKRLEQLSDQEAQLFSAAGFEMLKEGNIKGAQEMVARSQGLSESATDLTRLGVLQLSLNDVKGILNLEQALEKEPEQDTTRATLATAYLVTEQYDKAMQLAEEWKQQGDVQGYLLAGTVLRRQGQNDEARAEFEQAEKMAPTDPKVRLAVIDLSLAEGNDKKALQALEQLLDEKPSHIPALSRYFDLMHRQDQGDKGIERIKQGLTGEADDIQLNVLLAHAYLITGKPEQSIQLLAKEDTDKTLPVKYWDILGQSYLRSNKVKEANAHYDAWLNHHPHNLKAIMGKLFLFDIQGQFEQGLALSKETVSRYPDDIRLLSVYTHFLLMTGDFEQGRKQFDALPARVKDSPLGKGLNGRLLAGEGRCQEAMPDIQSAYENKPNHRHLVLAVFCLNQMGQREQSYELLNDHVERMPKDLASVMMLAEREIPRDMTKAATRYKQALQINGTNYLALNNLAYLQMKLGQLSEAREHAMRALEQRPEDPAVLDTVAQVLKANKDLEEAEKYLSRAAESKQTTDEIYLNYVELLFERGRTELAKRKLSQRQYTQESAIQRADALKAQYM
ncbi:XrtA/PEP-CTERM system TPR-repeat protein PrsT [Lacimicrobium sp. SS2-24]|uniref:XrtA/PEP-CTERM system TPR-repeat protein PrsT n=1 Tax=Lacimicrobium sp. SS2-24 TaxID=2005569 RepID=UPI000B4A8B47|nr:XrtA/PEP-CTERM system TPR-repeat protein PrsT [Lacimicrobium sp. SS2-24]